MSDELNLTKEKGRVIVTFDGNPAMFEDMAQTTMFDVNGFWTPVIIYLFQGDPQHIMVTSEILETKTFTRETPFSPVHEKATGNSQPIQIESSRERITSHWHIHSLPGGGFSLIIYPVLPHSSTRYDGITRLKLTLTSGSGDLEPYTEKKRIQRPSLKKNISPISDGPFANIHFSEPGMISIDGKMLQKAGINLRDLRPDMLQVYHWGKAIPARVISRSPNYLSPEDQILVWIDSLANPYGNYRHNPHEPYDVLQLTWNREKGLRFTEESGQVTGHVDYQPESFIDIVHLERAERWEKLSQIDQDQLTEVSDHWFFKNPIIAGTSDTFLIPLEHPKKNSERQVKVHLNFQGITYGSTQHELTLLLNNRFLAVDNWSGQTEKIISSEGQNFSHGHLQNGLNQLTVVMSGDPTIDRQYDMVLLDWAEIEYERYFQSYHDQLRFKKPVETGLGAYLYELKGFSSPDVMIIKDNQFWLRDYLVYYDSKYRGYSVIFQDESLTGKEKYVAVGLEGVVPVDTVIFRNPAENLWNDDQGDYLIIAHPDFLEALDDFVDLQKSRGFTPVVVDVTRLYDRYTWGNQSPYAIRDYLKEAWDTWHIRPRYVLLVGDTGPTGRSTYKQGMFIPTQFFQTYHYGACITDSWYGDVDDDLNEEISVGRLPVRDIEQLTFAFDKFRAWHEKPVVNQWLNRIVMIAGYEDEFKRQTETVISQAIPASVQVDRLYINPSAETGPFFGTTKNLSDMMNDGRVIINFRGHGGGAVWSDRSLFTLEDVGTLENAEKPNIITSFTCFTAAFETEQGLGEGLICQEGGSAGFIGSSGLGWVVNDYLMLQAIYHYFFEEGVSFGEAVQRGKLQYVSTTGWPTHTKTGFYQYNILGDPSLVLPFDYQKNNLTTLPPDAAPGEKLTLNIPNFSAPSAVIDLTVRGSQDKKYPIFQNILFKPASESNITITLPDTLTAEKGDITVFYWNENTKTYKAGHAPLSFGASVIFDPSFSGNIPEVGGIAAFYVKILDSQGVDSVWVRWSQGTEDLLTPLGSNLFESPRVTWDSPHGKTFTIRVKDENGMETLSDAFLLKPLPAADLAIYNVATSEKGLRLSLGSTVDDEIPVFAQCALSGMPSLTDTLYLIKGAAEYYPKWVLPYGNVTMTLKIFPLDYHELDSTNNVWMGTITNPWIYVEKEGIRGYSEGFPLNHSTFQKISMMTSGDPLFVKIMAVDTLFDLTSLGGTMDSSQIVLLDYDSEHITYSVQQASGKDTTDISAVYNPSSNQLLALVPHDGSFRGMLPGYLLDIHLLDTEAPQIEITVNSREILPGSYISDGARFSAIITDNITVHTDPLTWGVYLDGEKLDESLIKYVSDPSGRQLGLNFSPEFTLGRTHTLSVSAMDGLGNQSQSPEYELITSRSAQIIDYGCFPNPFGAKTQIIYELTSQFDEVYIEIYTLSGRRILRIDRFNAETDLPLNDVGYHEIPWYGRDKNDEFVANGVYFYRIYGKIGAESLSSKGKVVKLK
ncbi:MAG: C25 family cysteine peptidase [Candidatus Marinimicrobia bacterium]|nr:C25 family cysteine peptidase [Candidatus Neomarinimicrobiota bacterium]